ncbi:phosphatidylglycerol:prolipoprotein diacylglycerol transferase [Dysgonomonas sp. PH5-45]|uniref:prolipoprotein diacylglyceryl transferase n=1 Tax=unclassified Dysgonomonas TaxID=2630389 RepID=UPI00247726D6|nr:MULTISPECIES: prolipoprotein diacylglyceryl transferase [unclassified Dysgonomonas]MDH6354287.1 phosphatidylglycerol:prolipoprotein diacylglycerol transferase [Dysgonomonas sp. PH5-45]MDH6387188.1 phosphatidylglycerol:prolipoprotein diacylglycerol transferase [Dysgonomonas sp. PH5-37]
MLASITWDVDPEIFSLFGKPIVWYGLLWAVGLMFAIVIIGKIYKHEELPEKWFNNLFYYVVISLIIGARLGHCLFYNPEYYFTHPAKFLAVWEGGLSSHGGAIGIVIGVWLYSRKIHKSMIWTLDRVVVAAGLTGACIRLGNLLNSEIYGKPTTLPWGFNFVRDPRWSEPLGEPFFGSGGLPCHPTQIYEALIYLAVFCLAMYMYWKTDASKKQGLIFGTCISLIFVARILLEYLKNVQEPFEIQMRANYGLDMGQLLSIPFVVWGIWLVWNALKKKPATEK